MINVLVHYKGKKWYYIFVKTSSHAC